MTSVLFLGKKNDPHCAEALAFVQANFQNVHYELGKWGEPLNPDILASWQGDYVISYLSRWIVPGTLLARARKAAINFHPASPDYPGIGCNNFALYDGAEKYGATCHFMAPKVDVGEIIETVTFSVFESDTVKSLLDRTYTFQLALFYQVVGRILRGEKLRPSGEKWGRAPYTRSEFNELGKISPSMSPCEIRRRIRATSFGEWQPTVKVGDFTFRLDPA